MAGLQKRVRTSTGQVSDSLNLITIITSLSSWKLLQALNSDTILNWDTTAIFYYAPAAVLEIENMPINVMDKVLFC